MHHATDGDALCIVDSGETKELCIRLGSDLPMERGKGATHCRSKL